MFMIRDLSKNRKFGRIHEFRKLGLYEDWVKFECTSPMVSNSQYLQLNRN
jgi:hypothetical protein